MKRTFTKYPNNKVYATKAYTKAYLKSEPILVSANGNFTLLIGCGIGIHDTPYANFEIKCSNKADDAVVDIRLDSYHGTSYEGIPVINLPRKHNDEYAYVNYGFKGQRMSNAWVRYSFVPILNEALDFCNKLNIYFESNTPRQLSEMCKDVFLDMGIDYDSYIQQEADAEL